MNISYKWQERVEHILQMTGKSWTNPTNDRKGLNISYKWQERAEHILRNHRKGLNMSYNWQERVKQILHIKGLTYSTQAQKRVQGTVSRDFLLLFFYESVSPQPQSIPLGSFRIFSKSRGDIRSSRLTTGVADTGGKWNKILIILLEHLWIVELTYVYIFAFKFTLRYPQPDINLIVICCWHRRQICRRYRWHRWQICHRYHNTTETGWHEKNQKQKILWHCPFKHILHLHREGLNLS